MDEFHDNGIQYCFFFHISFYSRAVGKKQNKIAYNKIYKIKFQG